MSYTIDAQFTHPATGCVGIPVDFDNTSKGPIKWWFYSSDAYFGNPISFHWDYGDGNGDSFQEDGVNTYGAPGTYSVELIDTMHAWTGYCTDNKVSTIDIFPIPAAPASTPPAPVCEYDTIGDLTATGTGGDYSWYGDVALNNLLGTGSPFASNIYLPDTVFVTETVDGCESPGTQVILDFISNPIPTFTPSPQGGLLITFNGAPSGATYSWDFGDGVGTSGLETPSYLYSTGGPFNVCLDILYPNGCSNQHCETVTFVGVEEVDLGSLVSVFPNPANNWLTVKSPASTLPITYDVYSATGALVASGQINSEQELIDVSILSTGAYVIRLFNDSSSGAVQLIKR